MRTRHVDAHGCLSCCDLSRVRVASNPAASILPIVEKVAPELLEEVFWRAVALMPKDDEMAWQRGLFAWRVAESAIFLARHDRQAADVFVTLAISSLPRGTIGYSPMIIRAKAAVRPRGAVALMEALPAGGLGPRLATNDIREELMISLVEPTEDQWKSVWEQSGIPLTGRTP